MMRVVMVAISVIAALLLAAPAQAQIGDEGTVPIHLAESPDRDLDPVDPLPPVLPPMEAFVSDEMQLVGFTNETFSGNAGVLNMSLACQRRFRASRMCTMEEVSMSLYIPDSMGGGFAWVQNSGPDATPAKSCEGWMTDSPDAEGTSIELGECYGGLMMSACSTRLAVACCAREGLIPTR